MSYSGPQSPQTKRQPSQLGAPLPKRQTNVQQIPVGIPGDIHSITGGTKGGLLPLVAHLTPGQRPMARHNLIQQSQQSQQVQHQSFTPTPLQYGVPMSPSVQQPIESPGLDQLPGQHPQPQQRSDLSQQQPVQVRSMSEEEQQLATKLKETYKNIVNFEEVVQKLCIDLTVKINNAGSSFASLSAIQSSSLPLVKLLELSNDLWTVYHHNVTLLDNYYDFLVTALKPSLNQTQFKTGKNIVDLYKIPRRMWVYGIVGFLEVLKNIMTIFQDHEICLCFILYCFNVILNLTDPILEMEGWWAEKLGDLSRMAIALYLLRFIDWKVSAEHWYAVALRTLYGHGKIYYHMCTVQQDNLEALVNIGKLVFCSDPFVPTSQYLRLVVENICTQRNILSLLELPSIDFIKIHKVMLSIHPNSGTLNNSQGSNGVTGAQTTQPTLRDSQLQYGIDLVTRYGITFGQDPNGFSFFSKELYGAPGVSQPDHHLYFLQQQTQGASSSNNLERIEFWFNKGPLFALLNINHLVGLGDAKNPFAKLFGLPEALKERRDKKDRKRKSRSDSASTIPANAASANAGTPLVNYTSQAPILGETSAEVLTSSDWFVTLQYINKLVLELLVRILSNYLVGPKQALTGHVIVWLYFLVALGKATNKYPSLKPMVLWLIRKFLPWAQIVEYLNSVLAVVKSSPHLSQKMRYHLYNHQAFLAYFSENESLPEVWKCWGTLWFDLILEPKGDHITARQAGVINENIFDLPVCGSSPSASVGEPQDGISRSARHQQEHDNDERLVRIILLARLIADSFEFGFIRTETEFAFDRAIHESMDLAVAPGALQDVFPYVEQFLMGDGRFILNNFLQSIPAELLVDSGTVLAREIDEQWFGADVDDDNEMDDESFSEFDDEEYMYEEVQSQQHQQQQQRQHQQQHQLQHQHQQVNQHQVQPSQYASAVQLAAANQLNPHFHPHQAFQRHILEVDPFLEPEFLHLEKYEGNIGSGVLQTNSVLGTGAMGHLNPINSINGQSGPVATNNGIIEGNLGPRMDTNITYITLDTNIWLKHCGRVFKCIRNGIFKILIPLIVFQELRLLRKLNEATIADLATRLVIIIRELYLSREILPLRFDGTVALDINETTEFENNSNWRTSVDETILNLVNEHDEIGKKLMKGLNMELHNSQSVLDAKSAKNFSYCILITDDRNMRLRSKTIGLTSFQSRWLFAVLESMFAEKCID